MKLFLSLLFIAFFLFGCGKNSGESSYKATESASAPLSVTDDVQKKVETSDNAEQSDNVQQIEQMLIKRGYLTFQTDDVEEKHQQVLKLVKSFNGYVSNDQNYSSANRITYKTEIRIPKKHFDSFISKISQGVSFFDQKDISVEDVTEEFVDIQARLKTKKELENRYLELLKKAKTVTEMLEIERQIGDLQADIESIEGRMKYLTQQVKYSTLNLEYYKNTSVENQFGQEFSDGFKNGWNNLIWFFVGLVNIWPFLLIIGLLLFLFIRWIRKASKKKK